MSTQRSASRETSSTFRKILEDFNKHEQQMHVHTFGILEDISTDHSNMAEGAINTVIFKQVDYLAQEPLTLAITQRKPQSNSQSMPMAVESRKLLCKYNIRSPFIGEYIYTQIDGFKAGKREWGDLETYLEEKPKLTLSEARKLIGQILLGLNELHLKNLIHRDGKPANILINKKGDIQIIDLDSIVEVGKNNRIIGQPKVLFTPTRAPAELIEALGYQQNGITKKRILNNKGHLKVNAKAVEIYNFGTIFKDIVMKLPAEDRLVFKDFIRKALADHPEDRPTVQQMIEDSVWGTPEFRQRFFSKLEADALKNQRKEKECLFSTGFDMTLHPEESDTFNLMSVATFALEKDENTQEKQSNAVPGIKDIFFDFERLKNKIKFLYSLENASRIGSIKKRHTLQKRIDLWELETVYKNAHALTSNIYKRIKFLENKKNLLPDLSPEAISFSEEIGLLRNLLSTIQDNLQSELDKITLPILSLEFENFQKRVGYIRESKTISSHQVNEIRKIIELFFHLIQFVADPPDISEKIKAYIQVDLLNQLDQVLNEATIKLKLALNDIKQQKLTDGIKLHALNKEIDVYINILQLLKNDSIENSLLIRLNTIQHDLKNAVLALPEHNVHHEKEYVLKAVLKAIKSYSSENTFSFFGRRTYRGIIRADNFLIQFKEKMKVEDLPTLLNYIENFCKETGKNTPTSFNTKLRHEVEATMKEVRAYRREKIEIQSEEFQPQVLTGFA